MKTISSKDNPAYRDALRLLRKKYRDQTGMFLLEGPRPVMDAVKAGNPPAAVFVRESDKDSPQLDGLIETDTVILMAGVVMNISRHIPEKQEE